MTPYGYYIKGNRAIFGPNFIATEGPGFEKYRNGREFIPFYSEPQYPGQEPFAHVRGICLFFNAELKEFSTKLEWDASAYEGVKE
jgi:hypothetical protein